MTSPHPISRSAEFDFLRVMAAFGVVIIHSSAALFYDYDHRLFWYEANFWDSICRISVPLFFLLSGALILNPQKDPGDEWLRPLGQRLLRLAIPLAVWSLIYILANHVQNHVSIGRQIIYLFSEPASYHLPFIYLMLSVYLLLPLLWILHRGFLKDYRIAGYCFTLCLLSYVIIGLLPFPFLQAVIQSPLIGFSGYFLLGGFLRYAKLDIPKWVAPLMFAGGSCATFMLTWYFSRRNGAPSELFYTYLSFNIVIAATGCFLMIPRFSLPAGPASILTIVSEATFFIFFVHVLVMRLIDASPLRLYVTPTMLHPLMGIPLYAAIVFLISFGLSQVARLVPCHHALLG